METLGKGNFTIVPNQVFELDISPSAKLIFICLLRYSNYGVICPSIETLAKMANMSVRSVNSATKELETMGIIEKTRRYKDSTFYKICCANIARHTENIDSGSAKCVNSMVQNLHTISNKNISNNLKSKLTNGPLNRPSTTHISEAMNQFKEYLI